MKLPRLAPYAAILFSMGFAMYVGLFIVGRPARVEGRSMSPALPDGTWVIEHLYYPWQNPSRGDIVILLDGKAPVIKRIIGLPGDTVSMMLGYVFLNGKLFDEAYIAAKVQTASDKKDPCLSAGPGEYIVMGDNRPISRDSRAFGPVPRKLIQGRIN